MGVRQIWIDRWQGSSGEHGGVVRVRGSCLVKMNQADCCEERERDRERETEREREFGGGGGREREIDGLPGSKMEHGRVVRVRGSCLVRMIYSDSCKRLSEREIE